MIYVVVDDSDAPNVEEQPWLDVVLSRMDK